MKHVGTQSDTPATRLLTSDNSLHLIARKMVSCTAKTARARAAARSAVALDEGFKGFGFKGLGFRGIPN